MRSMRTLVFLLLSMLATLSAAAEPPDGPASTAFETGLDAIAEGTLMSVYRGVQAIAGSDHPLAADVLAALEEGRLLIGEDARLYIRKADGSAVSVVGGAPAPDGLELREPRLNNAVRREVGAALARLRIRSEDRGQRLAAARALAANPDDGLRPLLERALSREQDQGVAAQLRIAMAQIMLDAERPAERIEAARILGETGSFQFQALLQRQLKQEEVAGVRAELEAAIDRIERWRLLTTQAGNVFYGLSLGSVLLLSALGLAITFGLMGVINMAHGEMLMLGAYSTYVVQTLFRDFLPGHFDAYLLAAIPVAFAVTALVGVILERLVIRHLYGRPLETLLATWGISLILIQAVRLIFGAQNVAVANPAWLSGGITAAEGLVLTYNRIATIAFALLVLTLAYLVLQRTRLGLTVRAVTQNRSMAAALGVATHRVDMWTFGLGSGIAGLGGVALSQLDNVGPELGQSYIVDSFMVVVLGGVGQLAGAAVGAFGLGLLNKFLEPSVGAVMGKVLLLVFVVLFIQRRPQGLFALRGRAAEA